MNELSVQAKILAAELGVFSMFKQMEVEQALKFYAKDGDFEGMRLKMLAAWEDYRGCALRWAYPTAERFLSWPQWDDRKSWPWMEVRSSAIGSSTQPSTWTEADDAYFAEKQKSRPEERPN